MYYIPIQRQLNFISLTATQLGGVLRFGSSATRAKVGGSFMLSFSFFLSELGPCCTPWISKLPKARPRSLRPSSLSVLELRVFLMIGGV